MIIAATGHRPNKLGGYAPSVFDALVALAVGYIEEMKPTKGISGMALGWDMAWAQALIHCRVPFIAAIPFVGQEAVWPYQSKNHYHSLLKKAETIYPVCPPGYAAWKMQKRNEWMVNQCDRLVALYDGTSGGTANCVGYARKKQKDIDNLWDRWAKCH